MRTQKALSQPKYPILSLHPSWKQTALQVRSQLLLQAFLAHVQELNLLQMPQPGKWERLRPEMDPRRLKARQQRCLKQQKHPRLDPLQMPQPEKWECLRLTKRPRRLKARQWEHSGL